MGDSVLPLKKEIENCQYSTFRQNKILVHKFVLREKDFYPQYNLVLYRFDYSAKSDYPSYSMYHGKYGYYFLPSSAGGSKKKLVVSGHAIPIFVDSTTKKTWDMFIKDLEEFEIYKASSNLYAYSFEENFNPKRFLGEAEKFLGKRLDDLKKQCQKKIDNLSSSYEELKSLYDSLEEK